MPYLVIEKWQGREFVSVYMTDLDDRNPKYKEQTEDGPRFRKIELQEGDATLQIEVLKRLYADQIAGKPAPKASAPVKMKRSKLLGLLDRIIRESKHDGEVEAAKALWKKTTNEEWTGKL